MNSVTVKRNFKNTQDSVIACLEISNGNCFKQLVDFFRNSTILVSFVFYKDRMEIVRGNHDTTLINRAVFENLDYILDYKVNVELFNDINYSKTITEKFMTIIDGEEKLIEREKTVKDPRHFYTPNSDLLQTECKLISKMDGFRITIYKLGNTSESYMKAHRISNNSSQFKDTKIPQENCEFFDYPFSCKQPRFSSSYRQKIKLNDFCSTLKNFVKHQCDTIDFMIYPNGFRIKSDTAGSVLDHGWGVYYDDIVDSKIKLNDSKYHSFQITQNLLKYLVKIHGISDKVAVALFCGNNDMLQIVIPIYSFGPLIITILKKCEKDNDDEEEVFTKPTFDEISDDE